MTNLTSSPLCGLCGDQSNPARILDEPSVKVTVSPTSTGFGSIVNSAVGGPSLSQLPAHWPWLCTLKTLVLLPSTATKITLLMPAESYCH